MTKATITGTGNNLGFEDVDNKIDSQFYDAYIQSLETLAIKAGSKVTGTIVSKNEKFTIVDISNKSNVIIENSPLENTILNSVEVGGSVELLVNKIVDKKDYNIFGSVYDLKMMEAQGFLSTAFEERKILTGTPVEFNHAGYSVQVNINDNPITLFMPHLLADVNKLPDANSIIDSEIEFILEATTKDGNTTYIASRKAYLLTIASKELKKIKKGNMYTGFVTGTVDFGVFIQFNEALTGMIHKSNLTAQAREMLEKGEITNGMNIEFYVKDVMGKRLFLTQTLQDSLWDSIEVNQEMVGTVSSIKDFGILVDLDYETKGLLHKSLLTDHMTAYTKGDKVNVVVTNVNKNNRQITLALK